MTKLKFNISMSLDGFIAGPDPGPAQPLGAFRGGEHERNLGEQGATGHVEVVGMLVV